MTMPQKQTYHVGIEIEVDTHPRIYQQFSQSFGITTHDDGSIRKPHYTFGNYFLVYQEGQEEVLNIFCRRTGAYGTELTTRILTEVEAFRFMREVERIFGHIPFTNPRTSIHIHIDVRNRPWTYVYKVLLLFYILEEPLYRLACAGDVHRGTHNDFIYCRPISHPIGIYTSDTPDLTPCVRINSFLKVKTATDLLKSWGYLNNVPIRRHYIPHRLMGINLRSVVERGSLEWRIFDGRYNHASAFLRLVLAVHRAAETYQIDYLQRIARESPWIFGANRQASIYDVFGMLFPDAHSSIPRWLQRLWGADKYIPFSCSHSVLESHYDARNRYIVPTESGIWYNNHNEADNGTETFSLYVYAPEREEDGDDNEEEDDDE